MEFHITPGPTAGGLFLGGNIQKDCRHIDRDRRLDRPGAGAVARAANRWPRRESLGVAIVMAPRAAPAALSGLGPAVNAPARPATSLGTIDGRMARCDSCPMAAH